MGKKDTKIRIGQQVLREDDLTFTVEYNEEIFTLRHPSPLDRTVIEAEISRRLGGASRDSYPGDHLTLVEACTYIDHLLVREESPEWFDSPWKCYDEECIGVLYRGYLQFRNEFQSKIKRGGLESAGP